VSGSQFGIPSTAGMNRWLWTMAVYPFVHDGSVRLLLAMVICGMGGDGSWQVLPFFIPRTLTLLLWQL